MRKAAQADPGIVQGGNLTQEQLDRSKAAGEVNATADWTRASVQ